MERYIALHPHNTVGDSLHYLTPGHSVRVMVCYFSLLRLAG